MGLLHRYAEDFTGENIDNLVIAEPYTLSQRQRRIAVPKYGPFFSDSLVIVDHLNPDVPLIRGTQYTVPCITQELTLRAGKEIADAFIIEDPTVSNKIKITYQCVGGLSQNSTANIAEVYEAWLNDNRTVDWITGVLGKPDTYPPSPHPHWLDEIFGFEPIAFGMERLVHAITMGNTDAWELFLKTVSENVVTEAQILHVENTTRGMTFNRHLYATQRLNYNTFIIEVERYAYNNGEAVWVHITATNWAANQTLVWTLEHETTDDDDFISTSGIVNFDHGKAKVMFQVKLTAEPEEEEYFSFALRKNSPYGPILAQTGQMKLWPHEKYETDRLLHALRLTDLTTPRITLPPKMYFAQRRMWASPFR